MTCFLLIQGNPVEHIELLTKIKAEISCFNSTYDVQRFEELLRLKEYLHYRIRTREYEANLAVVHGNIAELRSTYVNGKLAKYDNAEKKSRRTGEVGLVSNLPHSEGMAPV